MPRRRKGGNWGDSPEKYPELSVGSGYSSYGPQNEGISSDHMGWGDSLTHDQNATLHHLIEMFRNQIDPGVIQMVLTENNWQVNEAVDKLSLMATDNNEGQLLDGSKQRIQSRPENIPGIDSHSRLPTRRSRVSESGCSLTMLSPKTPSQIGIDYPEMFSTLTGNNQNIPGPTGMGAFDSYGMGYSSNFPELPYESDVHQRSSQSYQQMPNIYDSSIKSEDDFTSPYPSSTNFKTDSDHSNSSHHGPRNVSEKNSNSGKTIDTAKNNKHATTHQEQKNRAQKRGRKTTMSLNPEEREALENLIEDVIVGIGEGVIDSEESTSEENESEEEVKTPTESSSGKDDRGKTFSTDHDLEENRAKEKINAKDTKGKPGPRDVKKEPKTNEQGQKVYPPQLKVAVKHMKNLPPRFLRKIQTNKDEEPMRLMNEKPQRIQEVPEPPEPPKPVEILTKPKIENLPLPMKDKDLRIVKSKEEQKMEKKKKVRGMLDTLDHYFEQSSTGDDKKPEQKQPEDEGEVAIIAPVNENPYRGDKLPLSAPASTQVSPNTQTREAKNMDIGHIDPAIKAQGPPVLSLQQMMQHAPPPLPSTGGQNYNSLTPRMIVPDSPGMNCEELEREMFQLSGLDPATGSKSSGVNYSVAGPTQATSSMSVTVTGPTSQAMNTAAPSQFTHSPPMKQHLVSSQQQQQAQLQQQALYHQAALNQAQAALNQQQMLSQPPPINHYGQFVPMNQAIRMPFGAQLTHQQKSQFSVDAPEFVPRTFTPNSSGQMIFSQGNTFSPQALNSQQPMYVTNVKGQSMPVVVTSQQISAAGLISSSINSPMSIPPPPVQGSHLPVQIPEGFTAPPPPLPSQGLPVSLGVGRASPKVNSSMALMQPTQEQLVASGVMGRSSPIPGTTVPPPPPQQAPFMIPKLPPQTVGAHPPLPPGAPPGGGMGMVYAPVYPHYPPGMHPPPHHGPPPQFPIHATGPFLVPAWSGGRKDKFNSLPLHHYPPATLKHSGIATKTKNASLHSNTKGATSNSSKVTHRSQIECSPQQAKDKVQQLMGQGKKVMVILRGLPGSGKSTLAKEAKFDGVILSTDDFFTKEGKYEFDVGRLTEAHESNRLKAKEAVEKGTNPVIIDNTHTQAWEMRAYIALALKHEYHVEIVEPNTPWKFKVKELAQKNTHGVPQEKIQQMAERYEANVSLERIMGFMSRKSTPEDAQPEVDGEGDEKKPTRKRRRRRRRRKKKLVEENASDSEKDEPSSDEEMPVKPEKVPPRKCSTDTTENEMDKPSTSAIGKTSLTVLKQHFSSSLESEDQHVISKESKETEEKTDFIGENQGEKFNDVVERKDSLHEDVTDKSQEAIMDKSKDILKEDVVPPSNYNIHLHEDLVTTEPQRSLDQSSTIIEDEKYEANTDPGQREVEIKDDNSTSKSEEGENDEKRQNECDEGFQEIFAMDGSPARSPIKEACTLPDGNSIQKEESVDQDLELDCMIASANDSESSCSSNETEEGIHPDLAVVSQSIREQLTSDNALAKKVKSVLREEMQNIVKEQIVESLHGEVDKLTDSYVENESTKVVSQSEHSVDTFTSIEGLGKTEEMSSTNVADNEKSDSVKDKEVSYWGQKEKDSIDNYSVPCSSAKSYDKAKDEISDTVDVDSIHVQDEAKADFPDCSSKAQRERRKREKASESWDFNDEPCATSSTSQENQEVEKEENSGKQVEESSTRVETEANITKVETYTDESENHVSCNNIMSNPNPVDTLKKTEDSPDFETSAHEVSCGTRENKMGTKNWKSGIPKLISGVESLNLLDSCNDKKDIKNETSALYTVSSSPDDANRMKNEDTTSERCAGEVDEAKIIPDVEQPETALGFLKRCFPDAEIQYLEHMLGQCEGNKESAVNVLLDAGYEFCFSEPQDANKLDESGQSEDKIQQSETVSAEDHKAPCNVVNTPPANSHTVENNTFELTGPLQPVSLLTLCYENLSAIVNLLDTELFERIASTGEKRLLAIDDFIASRRKDNIEGNLSGCAANESELRDNVNIIPSPLTDIEQTYAFAKSPPQASNIAEAENPYLFANGDIAIDHEAQFPPQHEIDVENRRASLENETEEVVLTLNPELANQLVDLFGPIGFVMSTDSMTPQDLRVRLSRRIAKQIHNQWSMTLKQKFAFEEAAIDSMMRDDEELARQLQEEENGSATSSFSQGGFPPQQMLPSSFESTQVSGTGKSNQCNSLRDIMNEQYEQQAIVESRRDYESRSASSPERHLATRLKKQQLYEMYPLMDQPVIDDIFEASGYSIESTKAQLEELFGQKEPVKNVITDEAKERMEQQQIKKAIEASMREEWLGESSQDNAEIYTLPHTQPYDSLCDEVSRCYRLRREYFEKAQDAYQRGMKPLASWYSQMGQRYSQKLKESNRRAAELLVEERREALGPNTIDLHGMSLEAALETLKRELDRREADRRARPDVRKGLRQLSVVTGWGKHSQGRGKLRPNIITWLKQHNYSFTENTVGKLDIVLK